MVTDPGVPFASAPVTPLLAVLEQDPEPEEDTATTV